MPPTRERKKRPASFDCPNCGAPVEVRFPGRAVSAVCPSCGSVIDTSTPQLQLLQKHASRLTVKPKIELGKRGKFRGTDYEVVGFLRRGGSVEGYSFQWDEYLLYNPFHGYRFLADTKEGWATTSMTNTIPWPPKDRMGKGVVLDGRRYTYREKYHSEILHVLGEFYWQVSVGEKTLCYDFKSGAQLLMGEEYAEEYIWSLGGPAMVSELNRAFGLKEVARPRLRRPSTSTSGSGEQSVGCQALFWVAVIIVIIIFVAVSSEGGIGGGYYGGK